MLENRKHSRVEVNLPISCTFLESIVEKKTFFSLGQVQNISMGGMKITLPNPTTMLHTNKINYFLFLPAPFTKLSGTGTIRWAISEPNQPQMSFGIKFNSLKNEEQEEIQCIIHEVLEEQKNHYSSKN